MRIIIQFTFFAHANGSLLLYLVLYRSYEDENADVSLPLPLPCFQHSCKSSMSPTEMPTTSENHKNTGGCESELNRDSR